MSLYKWSKINIFPDFPPSVAKRRAAFARVRDILRGIAGVKKELTCPAKPSVTHGNMKNAFTDPKEALNYRYVEALITHSA